MSSYAVNIVDNAAQLGLSIRMEDLSSNISGKLRKEDGKWVIVVNKNHHINRQRFTIAHEIGHYVLHRKEIGEGVEDDEFYRSDSTTNKIEQEANKYAALTLMPSDLLRELLAKFDNNIEKIAEALQVSETSLKIRLGIPT